MRENSSAMRSITSLPPFRSFYFPPYDGSGNFASQTRVFVTWHEPSSSVLGK